MAKVKKNITIHPVNNGVVDNDTDLFPKTLVGNIYQSDTETPYPFDTVVHAGDNISILNNDAGYAKTTDIHDGVLSIIVDGQEAGTFSANQSNNTTISITTGVDNCVPKDLSIITNVVTPKSSTEIQQSVMSIYVDNNGTPSKVAANQLDYSKITVIDNDDMSNVRNNDFIFKKEA